MKRQQHHILFNRRSWEATDTLKELRQDKRLITPLDPDTHRELHQAVSHVPPLSYHIARRALYTLSQFDYTDNPIEAADQLQLSIDEAMRHPRADTIERGVGELALLALELQKPFFEPNMPTKLIDLHQWKRTG